MTQTVSQKKPQKEVSTQTSETSTKTSSASPKKKGKGLYILLGCLGVVILSICACCISFWVMAKYMPEKLVGMFVSEEPLNISQPAPWSKQELEQFQNEFNSAIQSGQAISMSGEEVTQLLSGSDPNIKVFKISVDEKDRAILDLSYQLEDTQKYLNVHVSADMELENGQFSKFIVNELKVGNFNMGQFMKGRDMSADINMNMQNDLDSGEENPIENIEYFGIENGKFKIKLSPEFFENTNPNMK